MAVLIPIALEIKSGRHVTADEVPRGNACGCECIFCGVPMQVRQRDEIRFFAHQPREVDEDTLCPASFIRCLFWMARKVLSEHSQFNLPAYTLTLSDRDTRLNQSYTVTSEKEVTYDQVSFPDTQINPHNDTAILSIQGHSLRLCLCFDSAASPAAEDRSVPTLAVNISSLESAFNQEQSSFKAVTEKALLENMTNKRWIYHPREANARQQFDASVAEAKEEMTRSRSALTTQAAKDAFEDIMGINRRWNNTAPTVSPPRHSNDPSERLRRYWRKLEKGLVIHLPGQGGAARAAALHRMGPGFDHKGVVLQAVCTRHANTFNLHLSLHALTDFPTETLDRLGELNRPTLLICFGNPNQPYECMWVNQPPGFMMA